MMYFQYKKCATYADYAEYAEYAEYVKYAWYVKKDDLLFLGLCTVVLFQHRDKAHSYSCIPASVFVWILYSSRSLQNQMLSILS